jgi:hypothetical protein
LGNLRIVTDRHLDRILIASCSKVRATGAVTLAGAQAERETWVAEEVIVSASAIHTAAPLQRSGVGLGRRCRSLESPLGSIVALRPLRGCVVVMSITITRASAFSFGLKLGFRLGAKTLTDPLMKGWAGTVFPTN